MRAVVAIVLLAPCALVAQQPSADGLWSLQPLRAEAAVATPAAIDALVEQGLRERGLQPSPPADPRTRLRRLHLMLTGLMPLPEEVDAFVADPSDARFAAQVDRLLASPQCAEHLARRWLDLARYSDSNGLDENLAYGHAYRYRDWVVQAYLRDLPYDRFVTLQLAGDMLPEDDPASIEDRVVATGFLALGPRMLAEQDKEKLALDTVDEQLDLVGRTVLGLTLGCARCHDHKFDPVPTRDYYAMAGIFKSTRSFANFDHVSQWLERPIASPAEIAQRAASKATVDAANQALQGFMEQARKDLDRSLGPKLAPSLQLGALAAQQALLLEAERATATSLRADDRQWGRPGCKVLHTQMAGRQFASYEVDVAAGDYALDVRLAAAEKRPVRLLVDGEPAVARALDVVTGGWLPKDQKWHLAGVLHLAAGRHTITLEGLGPHMPHIDKLVLHEAKADAAWPPAPPAEAGLHQDAVRNAAFLVTDPDTALGAAFLAADTDAMRQELAAAWSARILAAAAQGEPAEEAAALARMFRGHGGVFELEETALDDLLPAPAKDRRQLLQAAVAAAQAAMPPEPPVAMCVADGAPVDLPVHLRGNHLQLAPEAVPRGFLGAVCDAAATVQSTKTSGRLDLARWIFTDARHLSARVAANRLWQAAFGEGIVRSESNFGARGDLPTHPELLDILAQGLVHAGWSQRALLRTLVLTKTWNQEAGKDQAALEADPDTLGLWRWRRQRLPAEAVRDCMLAAAGALDLTLGGSIFSVGNRGYVTNDQSGDAARYESRRRSLYLPVIRNSMFDLFTVFDYADPSVHLEQRPQSVVALQALHLLNSPFSRQQSAEMAKACEQAASDQKGRIRWIFRRALQRDPSPGETDAARRWLEQAGAEHGLAGLCQAVFCANEFLYVD